MREKMFSFWFLKWFYFINYKSEWILNDFLRKQKKNLKKKKTAKAENVRSVRWKSKKIEDKKTKKIW